MHPVKYKIPRHTYPQINSAEILRQEWKKWSWKLSMCQSFQVYLQGAVCDRREKDRDHQPQKLINIEFRPTAGFADSIKQARAGDDEKERHHPPGGKNVPDFHPDVSIDILNMPID